MSNQVPPGPGMPPQGSEPPYGPYSSQAPGVPPVPPPPGSYPPPGSQGVPPPYGQPPYGSESYGSPGSYGSAPQPYGPPSGPPQPSHGYDPSQPGGYGAASAPGYQPPPGSYQQGYAGGPYPGAPKSGSGGKIVAIVAAAVVVVGLVVGGVFLLTKGGSEAKPPATTSPSHTPHTSSPTPGPTTHTPTPTPTPTGLSNDQATALGEAAFPPAPGYRYTFCMDGFGDYQSEISASCTNSATPSERFDIYVYPDTATAARSLRADYRNFQESPWEHGTDFVNDAPGYFYDVVRCYSDAPVCVEFFGDTKEETDTAFSHFSYLDAAGISALNDTLAGSGT